MRQSRPCENVTVGSGCAECVMRDGGKQYSGGQTRKRSSVVHVGNGSVAGIECGWARRTSGRSSPHRSSSAAGYCGRGLRGLAGRGRGAGVGGTLPGRRVRRRIRVGARVWGARCGRRTIGGMIYGRSTGVGRRKRLRVEHVKENVAVCRRMPSFGLAGGDALGALAGADA